MECHPSKAFAALVALSLSMSVAACDSWSSSSPNGQPVATAADSPDEPTAAGQPEFRADPACGTYDGDGCAARSDRIDLEPPDVLQPDGDHQPLVPHLRPPVGGAAGRRR